MNWLQFILVITGVYTMYYLVIILLDLRGSARRKTGAAMSRELTFEEPVTAQKVKPPVAESEEPESASPATEKTQQLKKRVQPESVGIGGVIIGDIFALAKAEAIQFTGKVAF